VSAARFVAYYRVSTDKQSRSGLGLEARRAAVEAHVAGAYGAVAAEFIEIESGRKKDRPQLAAVAEEEARMISARTKAALTSAKARGIRLGNPNLAAGSPEQARAAKAVKTRRARLRAADVLPFIDQARRAGAITL